MSGPSYLSSPAAVSLHSTFVDNVFKRLAALDKLYPDTSNNIAARGRPMYDWLAAASGIPRRTLENLLTLSNQPTLVGAAAVARALGVQLDTLLGQEDVFTAPSPTRETTIACIHTVKQDGMMVCPACLAKWQSYQQRLRELHDNGRAKHGDDWRAGQEITRADQLSRANLPPGTEER